jgi:hypothetical protein
VWRAAFPQIFWPGRPQRVAFALHVSTARRLDAADPGVDALLPTLRHVPHGFDQISA